MNKFRIFLPLAFLTFILLGMSGSLMGIAWPSVRDTFGLSLDAIGWLLLTGTGGFFLASVSAGRLIARLGIGRLLLLAVGLFATGMAGQALAPAWWLMVAAAGLTGLASGAVDAGLNVHVAVTASVRVMNWMHGFFGIGATLGPLLMTAVFRLGWSWRVGFGIVGGGFLLMMFAFLIHTPKSEVNPIAKPTSSATYRQSWGQPIVWLGILIFFIYTGIEGTAGQWSYTLFTESRGVRPEIAGLWVSLYWGGLTAGRLLLGTAVHRIGPVRLVQASIFGVLVGTVMLWPQTAVLNISGLILTGFSLAAIFPTLMSLTPGRVTAVHANNAIGFQTGSASLGMAALPGLAGVMAEAWGLEIIAPFLLVNALLMLIIHQFVLARAGDGQTKAVEAVP